LRDAGEKRSNFTKHAVDEHPRSASNTGIARRHFGERNDSNAAIEKKHIEWKTKD